MRFKFVFWIVLLLLAIPPYALSEEALCKQTSVSGALYTVCTVDTRTMNIELFSTAPDGTPFGSFSALSSWLGQQGRQLVFAMNAGMFDDKLNPIGLYIEKGVRSKKVNVRDGYGNFHLKPNGVFYIANGETGVLETSAFLRSGIKADFATQSGPMLVVHGNIHPKFGPASTSFKRRNGVGVLDRHTAVFVISEDAVTFHAFASLFKDQFNVRNALFFDGSISSLFYGGRADGFFPLGPMVAVTAPQ